MNSELMKLSTTLSAVKQNLTIPDENLIGVFLYGSQNYNLATPESDVDTITLILEAEKPKQELTLPFGKAKIYTLQHFINRLKQGDLECYEILYTKYRLLNPTYVNRFACFINEFSACMSYDRIINSLYRKLDEHLHHVLWLIQNADPARYNKKRLYWAIRVSDQLKRIVNGEDFESSLVYKPSEEYDLIKIKTITDYLSPKDFSAIYYRLVNTVYRAPCHPTDLSDRENDCLSNFYTSMKEE